jgi:pyrroline-5-carboxylate reductase
MHHSIAIIGGGHLGSAIAKGLTRIGYPKEKITITQRNPEKMKLLQKENFRVIPALSNYAGVDIIILAVKPRDLDEVLRNVRVRGNEKTIVISAVSGVTSETLLSTLDNRFPLVRVKFSIFVEVKQEIIPLSICNSRANIELDNIKRFLSFLGLPYVVPDAIMEMSGWELTSLPGIIFMQLIKQRLEHAGPANAQLTERFVLSGLRSLLSYLEDQSNQGKTLSEAADDLRDRIATPSGANDKMMEYLQEHDVWSLFSQARKVYQDRIQSPHIIDWKNFDDEK